MLENLLTYERNLFLWLNDCHTPYWDEVMWLYSGKGVWLPLALLVLLTLCYRKDWREIVLVLLAIVLTITLCDQFASHVCKPLFTRFRPTHHPDFMNEVKTVFGYRGGRYGFISSHAANAFGFAMFLALLFRNPLSRDCSLATSSINSTLGYVRAGCRIHPLRFTAKEGQY